MEMKKGEDKAKKFKHTAEGKEIWYINMTVIFSKVMYYYKLRS